MGENLIPPENIGQGETQHQTDESPSNSATPNLPQEITSEDSNRLIDIVDIAGTVVLGTIAFALSDAGFHITAFIFYFLSVACGIHVLNHHVKQTKFRHKRSLFGLLMGLNFLLFTGLCLHALNAELATRNDPPSKPHFTFALYTSHAPKKILVFKNIVLPSDGSLPATNTSIVGIALLDSEPKFGLAFGIKNDEISTVDIDDMRVILALPKSAKFEISDGCGWMELNDNLGDSISRPEFIRYYRRSPQNLVPGDMDLLSGLSFSSSQPFGKWGNVVPVLFTIRAKHVPEFNVGFWLSITKLPSGITNLFAPRLLSPHEMKLNSNGMIDLAPTTP